MSGWRPTWEGVELKYPVGAKFTGRVTHGITDYGAFVELEPGVEGLVHVSEMSWTKKNVHPRQDRLDQSGGRGDGARGRSRQALDLARPQAVPRQPDGLFQEQHPAGGTVEGEIRNILPSSACSSASTTTSTAWSTSPTSAGTSRPRKPAAQYKKGDVVQTVVLDVDVDKERISLGMKRPAKDPFQAAVSGLKRGARVTCVVKEVTPSGIEVATTEGVTGFIRKAELSRDRSSSAPVASPSARHGDQHRRRRRRRCRSRRSRSRTRNRRWRITARRTAPAWATSRSGDQGAPGAAGAEPGLSVRRRAASGPGRLDVI